MTHTFNASPIRHTYDVTGGVIGVDVMTLLSFGSSLRRWHASVTFIPHRWYCRPLEEKKPQLADDLVCLSSPLIAPAVAEAAAAAVRGNGTPLVPPPTADRSWVAAVFLEGKAAERVASCIVIPAHRYVCNYRCQVTCRRRRGRLTPGIRYKNSKSCVPSPGHLIYVIYKTHQYISILWGLYSPTCRLIDKS